jgi:mRNA-degrading endonuclease toxin of MazEF toxin-antitoxin module
MLLPRAAVVALQASCKHVKATPVRYGLGFQPPSTKVGTGGLTMDSIVVCEPVRAINKTRLKHQMGKFDKATMTSIAAALKITLDLT